MSHDVDQTFKDFLRCASPVVLPRGMHRACGVCSKCLDYLRWVWKQRILLELQSHSRNVFLTLTFRNDGTDHGKSIQDWLKRIRKSGDPIRFSCFWENGERFGRLHAHLLIHSNGKLSTRDIRAQWKEGFTRSRVLGKYDPKIASYASKAASYASKSLGTGKLRRRASVRYGCPLPQVSSSEVQPIVCAVLAAFPDARVRSIAGVRVPSLPAKKLREQLKPYFPPTR